MSNNYDIDEVLKNNKDSKCFTITDNKKCKNKIFADNKCKKHYQTKLDPQTNYFKTFSPFDKKSKENKEEYIFGNSNVLICHINTKYPKYMFCINEMYKNSGLVIDSDSEKCIGKLSKYIPKYGEISGITEELNYEEVNFLKNMNIGYSYKSVIL